MASLARNRIGAIVVTHVQAWRVEGIISERDVVRLIGERGVDVLSELAGLMTKAVVTCAPDETVPQIMERMTRGRFRHVPVVAGGKLVASSPSATW